jgi:hypothetical protein
MPPPTATATSVPPTPAVGFITTSNSPSRPVPPPTVAYRPGIAIQRAVVTSAACEGAACSKISLTVAVTYNLTDEALLPRVYLSAVPLLVYGTCLNAGARIEHVEAGPHTVNMSVFVWFLGEYGVCAGRTVVADEIYAIRVTVTDTTDAALNTSTDFPFFADIQMTR